MTFEELISIAKLFSRAVGSNYNISQQEMDIACEALKKMSDNKDNWNQMQRETYKQMVDYAKESTRRGLNG